MSQPPPSSPSQPSLSDDFKAHQDKDYHTQDFDAKTYVEQALYLQQIAVPAEQMAGIIENFERVRAIAQPVLNFPLPDSLEPAPRFEP